MKTPGNHTIRNVFNPPVLKLDSFAHRTGFAGWILGCAILIAAIIPPAGAAPQAGSVDPTGRGGLALPSVGSNGQQSGSVTPDTLLGTLSATPSSVTFSSVPIGLANSQTVSLTNTGSASVLISRATVVGAGFHVSGLKSSTSIAPGQSVSFNVSFKPSSATTTTATASIYSNASNSPFQISFTGTGASTSILLGVNPASLSFGNVTIGSGATQNVTLTNTGNVSVTIIKISVPSGVFTTSGVSAGSILAPSQSAALSVTYSPTSATTAGGSISITSSASTTAVNIAVAGAGVQSAPQSVSLNWTASNSNGVIGYYVYRGTVSGGPYTVLDSSPDTTMQYSDATVQPSTTYYYVVTSVDSSNMQSGFSAQVIAVIPAG